jgi:hypothetical protein
MSRAESHNGQEVNGGFYRLFKPNPDPKWPAETKVHGFRPDDQGTTLCGKAKTTMPQGGRVWFGDEDDITCRVCRGRIETERRYERERAEAAKRVAEHEAQKEQESIAWWEAYNAYLQTEIWRRKRQFVLERCKGRCEGCFENFAAEIHHLRYPQNVLPGSKEWIAQEKLFTLVAVCHSCHADLHPWLSITIE